MSPVCVCKCFCRYPSATLCDFESECLWTPSNRSEHGDWKVTSPSRGGSEQTGATPAADHSVGSSNGKTKTTHWGEVNRICPILYLCLYLDLFELPLEHPPWTFIVVFCLLVATVLLVLRPSPTGFLKWLYDEAVRTLSELMFPLCFITPRTFPPAKRLPRCRGLWDVWIPLNQPSFARKQRILYLPSGRVRGRCRGGKPHPGDTACSLQFTSPLCGS